MARFIRPGGLSLMLVLAGCVHPAPVTQSSPRGEEYVAMGSSFAAGAGIGPQQAGSPPRCDRTVNNYASLLAEAEGLALKDVSCGGATTAHILGAWDELPAQIEAVSANTRLVTITAGGNDLGLVGTLFGGSCRAGVNSFGGPCRSVPAPSEKDYSALEGRMVEIANEVHRRAPKARIVFVQYVSLLPETRCEKTVIDEGGAQAARAIARRLAQLTASAARKGDAELLAADALSLAHTPCASQPWSNGFYADYPKTIGAPWHPNAAGHAAIAKTLESLIGQGKTRTRSAP
ncbi:SGNH/GDSL hydrolase family protein [Rhizorhabdus sp. FW153]|uniref:SGNH/GDSL hydrolase family protein n=1 Tax=Rhizorhabdus sp. FW153 TaxID=3400216 RepID=UPI003CFA9428